MPDSNRTQHPTFHSLRESIEAFVAQHGLTEEWRQWQRAHPLEPPAPPAAAGIDFGPDMRDRRKGERRQGERRQGERRQG